MKIYIFPKQEQMALDMIGLIHNELLKIIGRWRSYIGFIGIAILMPLILWGFSYGGGEIHDEYASELGNNFLIVGSIFNAFLATYIVMNAFWIHMPFLVALAAGDAVAAEGASGTFRIILTRSTSRIKILFAKLFATWIYTALLILFLAFMSLGIGSLWLGSGDLIVFDKGILILDQSEAWVRMALSFGLAIFVMCVVATLCFMFSAMVDNAIGPIVGAIFLIVIGYIIMAIPIELFEKMEPYIFVTYFDVWQQAFKDPIPWDHIIKSLSILVIYTVGFIGISIAVFLKRDIKS
ncbi:MAG: ABC transporter permease subunit [Candidatus Marinimicrobia bacterium]|nr:ABC transporter permease subunit [Candidatus Neomarinimicrobiota bacterium]MBT3732064.1 ABC transporter permease subunit [Candidatus Neomarinimicrobiota bacterium]MBT4991663.1 ABC transporter permease subunit [Candidatus Neomarinimicrobiota bacterium]MBT6737137.1 ABC transporter permease subunit [Candidatus Neomarinimicrobiota bacterium]MBT6915466.1 ABC transporter permease subunit [Candidatus Neomarinimicrobiota bacterium]